MALGQQTGGVINFTVPYFSAYMTGAQAIGGAGTVKVQMSTELYDSHGWYDPVTNYRYTPLVKGVFWIFTSMRQTTSITDIYIYKNGAQFYRSVGQGLAIGGPIEMNGTTDYLETYVTASGATSLTGGASYQFNGFWIAPL